jgi:hypothetical protein
MLMFSFLFPPIRRSQACERCGLLFPKKEPSCTHCRGLSDAQLAQLKQRYDHQQEANARLGQWLWVLAIIIALGMLPLLF